VERTASTEGGGKMPLHAFTLLRTEIFTYVLRKKSRAKSAAAIALHSFFVDKRDAKAIERIACEFLLIISHLTREFRAD
jgi:hypothetical protein